MSCMIKGKMRSGLLMPIFLGSFALQAAAISGGSDAGTLKQNLARDNKIIRIEPDRQRLLRNPQTGWVLYATPGVKEDFWEKCDNMQVPGVGTVKVSDYAHTLYIRTSWRKLNPEENVYGWNTDPMLKMLIEGARARKMRLAFRVVVDSRDKGYDFTPDFVREAGTKGFVWRGRWAPYPDDPIFQKYYEKFVWALAKDFGNPDEVDFIDGTGLGKWGEYHTTLYSTGDEKPRKPVLDWLADLYLKAFRDVPVVINYHRFVGAGKDWDDNKYDLDSEFLLDEVVEKGYSLRHDAFGMGLYYGEWERDFAKKYFGVRSILMEGGWITGKIHSFWVDPRNYRKGHPEDVRQGEFDDSKEARVNMMDFRVGETESWFHNTFPLVQRFISEGGYRLYPDMISLPTDVAKNQKLRIIHRWNNLGWGYCPTNIPQWNQKYKVAFALMDSRNRVQKVFVDKQTDLSKWMQGIPAVYTFDLRLKGVTPGSYYWAVGLVDTTKDNAIGLEMAVPENMLNAGWAKLQEVTVR